MRRDFRYPWPVVGAVNPDYRAYVEAEIARMGPEHPLISTQYLLETLEGGGRLLSETQLAQLRGSHARLRNADFGLRIGHEGPVYVAGVDIAGEDEEREDAALRSFKPRKDSTAVTICEVTWQPALGTASQATSEANPHSTIRNPQSPHLRVVEQYWWTGRKHREVVPQLVDLLQRVWGCRAVVVDATGIGAAVASFLVGAMPNVVRPFVFTAGSKSALGYGLLAAINGGRLQLFANDGSPESGELWEELRLARSTLHENQRLSFYVDPREGHDDLLMSLALVVEAAAGAEPRSAVGRTRV